MIHEYLVIYRELNIIYQFCYYILLHRAIVCGGGFPAVNTCYSYDPDQGTWSEDFVATMTTGRRAPAATLLNGKLWIAGGDGTEDASSELFDAENKTFTPYVNLERESRQNVVALNSSTFMFLAGGFFRGAHETYIFDSDVQEWHKGPSMNHKHQIGHTGLVTFKDSGRKAVIMAGGFEQDTTEILYLDENNWISGPNLPVNRYSGTSVQWGDTFIIVGGSTLTQRGNANNLKDILKFNVVNGTWTELDQKLQTGRRDMAAFLVPDSFC